MLPLRLLSSVRTLLLTGACVLAAQQASAFAVFPLDANHSLKWNDNTNGTAGGTIHWSFIAEGTAGSTYCGTACPGNALTALNIENGPGTGYTPTPLVSLSSIITSTFSKWSSVANISFIGPASDPGLAVNDPAAAMPEIRIGVFAFSSGGGAVGFAPPPNGGTGAGDIIFDANSFYAFQAGNDGDAFPNGSTAPNDFESLLLHEMGHALGLAHPSGADAGCQVMDGSPACLFHVNRQLDADDIAGAQFLYGAAPAPVPLPTTVWTMGAALGVLGAAKRRRARG